MAKGMPTLVKQPSVPSLFTCPISLELMRDPVTLSTGQTYDRSSIEKWFESGHSTCPSTMQVISCSGSDIAPNRTLQTLIHSWCVTNNYSMPLAMSHSTENNNSSHRHGGGGDDHHHRPLLPKGSSARSSPPQQQQQQPRADLKQVQHMLHAVAQKNSDVHRNLRKLRSLSKKSSSNDRENRENRKVLRDAGAIPVLTNFVFSPDNLGSNLRECEEALAALLPLLPSSSSLHGLRKAVHFGSRQLTAISWLLNRGSLDGRGNAALFLASLTAHDAEMKAAVGATAGVFEGLVQLLKEELYTKSMESGLKAVLALVGGDSSGGEDGGVNGNHGSTKKAEKEDNINIVRCVRAGMVCAVAELLPEAEKRNKVRALARLLELLCSCAEGREAATEHALVVPVLVRIVSLGDGNASERAISCLWALCRHFPEKCIDEVAGQVGILTQLSQFAGGVNAPTATATTAIGKRADFCLVELDYKQRAAELLQLLRRRLQRCDLDLSRTSSGGVSLRHS